MTATLRSTLVPGLGDDVRQIVLDCPHGTTIGLTVLRADLVTVERSVVAALVARHVDAEGCGCAKGIDTLRATKVGARA